MGGDGGECGFSAMEKSPAVGHIIFFNIAMYSDFLPLWN